MSHSSIAEEKWYTPVDIGEHVDLNNIGEKRLNKGQIKEIFQKGTILKDEALKQYEKLRDIWLEKNGTEYQNKFKDNKI